MGGGSSEHPEPPVDPPLIVLVVCVCWQTTRLRLLADDSHELLSPISPRKFRKMSYNVSSASDIIGALRVDALSLGCIKSSLMGLKGHV